jgi:hypothetical protein
MAGKRYRYKEDHDVKATLIFEDGEFFTLLVDGYAASDSYSKQQLDEDWEEIEEAT